MVVEVVVRWWRRVKSCGGGKLVIQFSELTLSSLQRDEESRAAMCKWEHNEEHTLGTM